MRAFLPPGTAWLRARISSRNARRLSAALARLEAHASSGARRDALEALRAASRGLRGAPRDRFLFRPELRAWLAAVEKGLLLAASREEADDLTLFGAIAPGPDLGRLLPKGRLDRGFRRRARLLGLEAIDAAFRRILPLAAFRTPRWFASRPLPLDAGEDAEEARLPGEIHLHHPMPVTLRLGGEARVSIAAGGLRIGDGEARPRPLIPGTGIPLARRIVARRGLFHPGEPIPGAASRLGEALRLLGDAWPEGREEVLAHTAIVVPLVERNTVSFSLPERPGVSYINLRGKSLVDLADDLLHESAHHRLHGLEEIAGPLDLDDGEPRYWSPWRRSIRPLHGILHAAYTFTWRAALLKRMLRLRRPLPRAWLSREAEGEIARLRRSLDDLRDAEERGLLTPGGAALRRAIRGRVDSL